MWNQETFEKKLRGEYGKDEQSKKFWQRDAQKELGRMRDEWESGNVIIESDGSARWKSSGCYVPDDCAQMLRYIGCPLDVEATEKARDIQIGQQLAEYRKRMENKVYSEEELSEMRDAFGAGAVVVDVFTGRRIQL